ncbi:MAG TPA: helix-turn-helix domain-containing protein, partial [Rhodocyclaceae bacterium]|nr:helix-turn-helix domain-containing protein [Rhodocyclaceae bacterium]
MAAKQIPDTVLQEAVDMMAQCDGNMTEAAEQLGIPRTTLQSRMLAAARPQRKIEPSKTADPHALHRIKQLESELRSARESALDAEIVKRKIIGLTQNVEQADVPEWVVSAPKKKSSPGVPTLFASDWHFGEVVDPTQIGGVNSYNMTIARQRARSLITKTIDLLDNHMVNPEYPGIVFALGGDMVSGDIHEELMATNETEIMPVVVELFGILSWCVETLATRFGRVFMPCVGGNHGRNTQKIRAKGRNFTSFDWLLYTFLAKRFENDKRVTFFIPNGPDALYSVCGRRYLLTHGDQFRGGDGLIGALGPIIRGDHKKRSRNAQIDLEYDTMVLGHWHQWIQLERLIVNGSLIGYNEYAYAGNFGFEPPRQGLWITHPEHGITFSMPVHVGESTE